MEHGHDADRVIHYPPDKIQAIAAAIEKSKAEERLFQLKLHRSIALSKQGNPEELNQLLESLQSVFKANV